MCSRLFFSLNQPAALISVAGLLQVLYSLHVGDAVMLTIHVKSVNQSHN